MKFFKLSVFLFILTTLGGSVQSSATAPEAAQACRCGTKAVPSNCPSIESVFAAIKAIPEPVCPNCSEYNAEQDKIIAKMCSSKGVAATCNSVCPSPGIPSDCNNTAVAEAVLAKFPVIPACGAPDVCSHYIASINLAIQAACGMTASAPSQ